jgi:mono/diheme cytochrome c family protein
LNCASCHGEGLSGFQDIYPSLINIKERFSKKEVLEQINNGKGLMPAFLHLSTAEKDAVMAYLFGEEEKKVAISVSSLGEMIFKSNCASCHRATINDPKPANTWMMEPAPLAGATKRFTKDKFFLILEQGVCYMPSFDYLFSDEKNALYSFIKTLEGKGEPSGPTMGEMCPMMRMRKR